MYNKSTVFLNTIRLINRPYFCRGHVYKLNRISLKTCLSNRTYFFRGYINYFDRTSVEDVFIKSTIFVYGICSLNQTYLCTGYVY